MPEESSPILDGRRAPLNGTGSRHARVGPQRAVCTAFRIAYWISSPGRRPRLGQDCLPWRSRSVPRIRIATGTNSSDIKMIFISVIEIQP